MLTTNLPTKAPGWGAGGPGLGAGRSLEVGADALAQPGEEAAEEQLVLAGSPAHVFPQTPRSL